MELHAKAVGQKIEYGKPNLYFGPSTLDLLLQAIYTILPALQVETMGKYLGLDLNFNKKNTITFFA